MSFDLSRLAAKQKRVKTWRSFITHEVHNSALRQKMSSTLAEFEKLLLQMWEKEQFSPEDMHRLEDLERQLQQLDEEARLHV